MSTTSNDVTLESVGGGSAPELFARCLKEVTDNIADVNTDPEGVRKITMTFTFEPNQKRDQVDVYVAAVSKLVSVRQAHHLAYLGKRNGSPVMVQQDPAQADFGFDRPRAPGDKVIPLNQDNK